MVQIEKYFLKFVEPFQNVGDGLKLIKIFWKWVFTNIRHDMISKKKM